MTTSDTKVGTKVPIKGPEAIGAVAIMAGCRYYFGYPITPQNEVGEYLSRELPKVGGVFVQSESKLSAINMLCGTAAAAKRVMTSTSCPGYWPMLEGIPNIVVLGLPCVLVLVSRVGPGGGNIESSQTDYTTVTKGGDHGGYHTFVLSPSSLQELFDLVQLAFDLSDKYRLMAIIFTEGTMAQMMEPVEKRRVTLGEVLPPKDWALGGKMGRGKGNVFSSAMPTQISIVPALLRTIAAQPPSPDDRDLNLRVVFFAINVTDKEKEDFEQRFGVEPLNGYGLSEAMTVVTVAPCTGQDGGRPLVWRGVDREVKIVDDSGEEAPRCQIGELIVKGIPGRTLMKGYYKDPDAAAEALRDGWLHTGDNVYADELGYVYFFDRKEDVIKRAAENVSASEVERVLVDHPVILEAAVIGVPEPIRDEAVKAFVVLCEGVSPTEEQIIDYCAAHLAKSKVPSLLRYGLLFLRRRLERSRRKLCEPKKPLAAAECKHPFAQSCWGELAARLDGWSGARRSIYE